MISNKNAYELTDSHFKMTEEIMTKERMNEERMNEERMTEESVEFRKRFLLLHRRNDKRMLPQKLI